MDAYNIEIEIDEDTGDVVWTKGGEVYYYSVEELEGKGSIDSALGGGAQVTVYSQGQTYTMEEYIEIQREEADFLAGLRY